MSQRTYLTNADFSRMFYEAADMLELKDENVFKINALRKAARTIENLSAPVVELYNSGELASLPGIGKGLPPGKPCQGLSSPPVGWLSTMTLPKGGALPVSVRMPSWSFLLVQTASWKRRIGSLLSSFAREGMTSS